MVLEGLRQLLGVGEDLFNCSWQTSWPHSGDWVLGSRLLALGRPEPDSVTDGDTDRHKSREGPSADAAVSKENDEKGQEREQPEVQQDRLWPHQHRTSSAVTIAAPTILYFILAHKRRGAVRQLARLVPCRTASLTMR